LNTDVELEEAIANCSRDPIHIPGAIQAYGALVAADNKLERIEFASENTTALLGVAAADLLGQSVRTLLDSEQIHTARNALSHRSIKQQREVVGEKQFADKRFQISIHCSDDRSILEFLPMSAIGSGEPGALERTRSLLADSVAINDYQTVLDLAVGNLRAITGYDRVLACRFLPDDSGDMVAESRAANTKSFLGLRFPESDIPPIARDLIASIPVRVVADVDAENVTVMAVNSDVESLDMSLAILRGTVDVHLRYLRNMGVKGNMTIPITVGGKLWGLFALHHMKPRIPDPTMLIAAELSGKMLSLIIQHTVQSRHQLHLNNCTAIATSLLDSGSSKLSEENYWESHRDQLVAAIPSHGIAFLVGDKIEKAGSAPDDSACLAIRDLASRSDETLSTFNNLTELLPEQQLQLTAGALVMHLSSNTQTFLLLFRDLATHTVNWAGMPEKKITSGVRGLELSPRNSFESYTETVKGKCDEWSHEDLEVANVLYDALSKVLSTQKDKKDSQHRLKLLVRELNHRVRNMLTLVQSLSSSSKSSATSLEGYAVALEKRIIALAGAHDLLTREEMRGVHIAQIAKLELRPYLDKKRLKATVSGPDVVVNADVSPVIALVFHELVSNAVKYGALSTADGRISLEWKVSDAGLDIEWLEANGPAVVEPTREGFGRSLIENAIPYEFGGQAKIAFESTGVRANFILPQPEFVVQESQGMSSDSNNKRVNNRSIKSKSIVLRGLVVEDNYVIAEEAQRWFEKLGFDEIVAVATVKDALGHLEKSPFAFCLLDVNLRGDYSEPVAKKLTELGTPYLFASGYGSEGSELCDQFDVPFLTKPIGFEELQKVLVDLSIIE